MKNKLLAILATLGMVASASAVKINDNLSINGFIDGSWTSTDTNTAGETNDDTDLDIDEVELNFIVTAGSVSGEIHLDNNWNDRTQGDDGNGIEQAHFTYSFENGLSAQIGRFGTAAGLEREDPAGLYTYSRSYNDARFDLGNIDNNVYRFDGVRLAYASDQFSLSVAAFNPTDAVEETNFAGGSEDDLDYEIAVAFNGLENLDLAIGLHQRNTSQPTGGAVVDDITLLNVTAGYTFNNVLLLGEYIKYDEDNNADLSAYTLIADYDFNDKVGIAVRYSEYEDVTLGIQDDINKLTFAPNYAITESLGTILEYSSTDDGNNDEDMLAIELTYTF